MGGPVPDVKHSTFLAQQAADWATYLAQRCMVSHPDASYGFQAGQNLYVSWSGSSGSYASADKAVKSWAEGEFPYYSLSTWTCQAGQSCGHFTQVMWVTRAIQSSLRSRIDVLPFEGGATRSTLAARSLKSLPALAAHVRVEIVCPRTGITDGEISRSSVYSFD